MRCKKHPVDHSGTLGVCASCLRERLFVVIAAQAHQPDHHHHHIPHHLHHHLPKPDPPTLLFPRSVSPYVSRRKSDHHDLRFYATPQLGSTFSSAYTTSDFTATRPFKKKRTRFARFSNLFKFRSDSDPKPSDPRVSWFSAIFSARGGKKQSNTCPVEDTVTDDRRPRRVVMDRGMSPAVDTESEDEPDEASMSAEVSPGRWKRTPARRTRGGHGMNVSGLAFCLSPLVRASPNRQWNHKAPEDKPQLSTAASFCANRSRKLADFGRVSHNH